MNFTIAAPLLLLFSSSITMTVQAQPCSTGAGTVDIKYYDINDNFNNLPTQRLENSGMTAYKTDTTTMINYDDPVHGNFATSGKHDHIAAWFHGNLRIPANVTGFCVRSDDGSMLYLDDELIVDNNGIHVPRTRCTQTNISPGVYKMDLDFFEKKGHAVLQFYWTTDSGERVLVPSSAWVPSETNCPSESPSQSPSQSPICLQQDAAIVSGKKSSIVHLSNFLCS